MIPDGPKGELHNRHQSSPLDKDDRELQLREAELQLKREELALKQAEHKSQESFRFSPATLASVGALLASLSGLAGAYVKGVMDERVERQRFQQQVLAKALDNPDPEQARRNVASLVDLGILTDPTGSVKRATQVPTAPPSSQPAGSTPKTTVVPGDAGSTGIRKLNVTSADTLQMTVDVGGLTIPYSVALDGKQVMFSLVDRTATVGPLPPGLHQLTWGFTHTERDWHHRLSVKTGGGAEIVLDEKAERRGDSDRAVGVALIAVSGS